MNMEREPQEDYEHQLIEYEVYRDERKILLEGAREGSRSFDKSIMTLSAGALALSFTFVSNNLIALTDFEIFLLISTWIMLGASLCSIIISFQTSLYAHQYKIDALGKRLELNEESEEDTACIFNLEKKYGKLDRHTNKSCIVSGIAFALGVISLAAFLISILP